MEVKNINGYDLKDEKARNEIDILKNKNRKYIFIGDSYADGYTEVGTFQSWVDRIITKLNLTLNVNVFRNHLGGTGFVNSVDNKTFLTLLTDLNITDKESITDIVVLGGFNDRTHLHETIINAIQTFIDRAKELYPNATVHIGEIGWSTLQQRRKEIGKMISNCYRKIPLMGGRHIKNIEFSLHNYEWLTDDYGHPNGDGQESIANHLYEYLTTGFTNVDLVEKETTFGDTVLLTSVKDDKVFLSHGYMYLTYNFTLSMIGTYLIDVPYIKGKVQFQRNGVVWKQEGGYENVQFMFEINEGKLYVNIFDINSNGDNYKSIAVKQIQVSGGASVFDSYSA